MPNYIVMVFVLRLDTGDIVAIKRQFIYFIYDDEKRKRIFDKKFSILFVQDEKEVLFMG
jgi:hypothetical protein